MKQEQMIEILAPAGGMDGLTAAVRCGANAVYLGGVELNARQGAKNFDEETLAEAVSYFHARNVKVHLTLNTIVFDEELKTAEKAIKTAAEAGVDAFIIQDLAVATLAKACAPTVERHASTQMAVHNLEGVLQLAEFGFQRAVLARELTLEEVTAICKASPIPIECFIHGALCMSVSGQCYLSSMIGGRSGNRGRCAQPCRLPFQSEGSSNALSLKDLSVIEHLGTLQQAGIFSFKIEGRLKRPEYVAATVTACQDVLAGRQPDYDTLQAVFSRSGFTQGYVEDDMGDQMFGTRRKEDVVSASKTIKELAQLYAKETPLVPVDLELFVTQNAPVILTGICGKDRITCQGEPPQIAQKVATTPERAQASLEKMGGTPFYLATFSAKMEEGLMVPASQLNGLRRELLEKLLQQRSHVVPKPFVPYDWSKPKKATSQPPWWRVRLQDKSQLTPALKERAKEVVLPIGDVLTLSPQEKQEWKDLLMLEFPRMTFRTAHQQELEQQATQLYAEGFHQALVGDLGSFHLAKRIGFHVQGDFGLNLVNYLALDAWADAGLETATMSMEYAIHRQEWEGEIPKGLLIYGTLPMMVFRNHPAGLAGKDGTLTDRLGNQFPVKKYSDYSVLYNCVPLHWGDRIQELEQFEFVTLYFTEESPKEIEEILRLYQKGESIPQPYTRGLYQRRIE